MADIDNADELRRADAVCRADVLRPHDIAETLRKAGYKATRPRLAVLQILREADEDLSPLEIYERGKEVHKRLGLVTVYRTLEILDELGIARRVHTKGRCHGYARAEDDQHYLVCRRCGHVTEFPCDGLDALVESVRQNIGYLIEEHLLELTGLCPDCQKDGRGHRTSVCP